MIRFACPSCNKSLKAPDRGAGRKATCPRCGQGLLIPGPFAFADVEPVYRAPRPPRDPDPLGEFSVWIGVAALLLFLLSLLSYGMHYLSMSPDERARYHEGLRLQQLYDVPFQHSVPAAQPLRAATNVLLLSVVLFSVGAGLAVCSLIGRTSRSWGRVGLYLNGLPLLLNCVVGFLGLTSQAMR
jgi:hypothetical protein